MPAAAENEVRVDSLVANHSISADGVRPDATVDVDRERLVADHGRWKCGHHVENVLGFGDLL